MGSRSEACPERESIVADRWSMRYAPSVVWFLLWLALPPTLFGQELKAPPRDGLDASTIRILGSALAIVGPLVHDPLASVAVIPATIGPPFFTEEAMRAGAVEQARKLRTEHRVTDFTDAKTVSWCVIEPDGRLTITGHLDAWRATVNLDGKVTVERGIPAEGAIDHALDTIRDVESALRNEPRLPKVILCRRCGLVDVTRLPRGPEVIPEDILKPPPIESPFKPGGRPLPPQPPPPQNTEPFTKEPFKDVSLIVLVALAVLLLGGSRLNRRSKAR